MVITYPNGNRDWRSFDNDGRIVGHGVKRGSADRLSKVLEYPDGINLGTIRDGIDPTRAETFWYTPANRLQNTTAPWGELDFYTDGVGNRAYREQTTPGGATTTDSYLLAPGTDRIASVANGGSPSRSFTYDGAGNMSPTRKAGSRPRTATTRPAGWPG